MWQWLSSHFDAIWALLGSLIIFFIVKRGPSSKSAPTSPVLQPVSPPDDKKAQDQENEDQKKAEDQHEHDVDVVVQQQEDQEKQLEDDPNAENDFIKKVGEDVRKP